MEEEKEKKEGELGLFSDGKSILQYFWVVSEVLFLKNTGNIILKTALFLLGKRPGRALPAPLFLSFISFFSLSFLFFFLLFFFSCSFFFFLFRFIHFPCHSFLFIFFLLFLFFLPFLFVGFLVGAMEGPFFFNFSEKKNGWGGQERPFF